MNQPALWAQDHLGDLQDIAVHGTNSSYFWIQYISVVMVTSQLSSLIAVDGAAVTHADSSLSICHYEANTGPLKLQP